MKNNTKTIVENYLGNPGRLISHSKGRYRYDHPDNIVIYNSNLVDSKKNKVWYGDIDLTEDLLILKRISESADEMLYVLYEMDGRFDNEKNPRVDKAVVIIDKDHVIFNIKEVEKRSDDKWYFKKIPEKITVVPVRNNKNYRKEDFKFAIKVPIDKFSSGNPIDKFYKYLEKELIDKLKLDPEKLSLFISQETYNKIEGLVETFLIKEHKIKAESYEMQKELNWLSLDMPCTFMDSLKGPDWARKDTVYIKVIE